MSTTAMALKPEDNMKQLQTELQKPVIHDQIVKALSHLSRWVTPEKMIRVALTAIRGDEKLAICTPVSIIGSVIQLAQVGLVPDGFLGQAYLIAYFNKHIKRYECSPLIGYRGYGELAVRSGNATSVDAHTVYAGDFFEYEQGDKPYVRYRLQMDPKKRGGIIGAFAIVYMKEGPHRFEVMPIDQIEKVRGASQGADSDYSPWKTWYDEMVRKTPMRRLAKWVPLSPEFQMAAGVDEASELGLQNTVIDSATGQVLFVPKDGATTSVVERPARASATTVVEGTVKESVAPAGGATVGTAVSTGGPAASAVPATCLCSCCKAGKCECPQKEEFDRCECSACKIAVGKTVAAPGQPTGEELFPAEQKAGEDRPTRAAVGSPTAAPNAAVPGKFVPQNKLKKLFMAAASAGIKVVKDSHDDQLHQVLKDKFGINSIKEIPEERFNEVLRSIAPNLKIAETK